ncbi:bifunctional ADP-dependent NAD(P)H-hydrate dehydratase/NAD(P)H-hydrate epimerase [Beijerinckia indica]|uniref:Bifunctional NAD(P)H-hydrate repair enzyme n=1 Tax=Beijerinckia indica subsp. indica (strain ATCC 9039 / DSM 1715 / NCIMB 8712) TaxID=395963 RepID=B2IGQ0_BEII9|nr:bifunctional ADP-dependent NAD(P)H-hydrate dehydratase/NAD(P)H-hydrate epimerase [Beijerinckia indica]ACB95811.1 carbohydrate kinase, YjeF related protein [Beijerinckia indica subsp. indica ATCC 9039]
MSQALPLELLSNAETAEADRLTINSGVPGSFLMEQAGAGVAREALRLLPDEGCIVVLCGPGNNGGDGFVAARLLSVHGFDVRLGLLAARDALHGDADSAARAWNGPITAAHEINLEHADLVIDALFGAGLSRPLEGAARDLVLRVNEWSEKTGKPVLAVDLPSGINGTSGQILGVAIKARRSVTFFRRKPGHVLLPGRIHCGETVVVGIGIAESVLAEIKPQTFLNRPAAWERDFPVPRIEGHKYSRGHAVVVSGPVAQTGAARLAARGALRAGAGLVTVATSSEALLVHASALTAIMTRVCDSPADLRKLLEDHRKNVVVIGPGLGVGEESRLLVETILQASGPAAGTHAGSPRAFVLDADALTSFAQERQRLAKAIAASGAPVVLTPHEGEFGNLFADRGDFAGRSKPDRARAAAQAMGCVILLKGPDTVVAEPHGRATIADNAPPWLATAGSGDVLSGMIGGLLAQGMPAFEAASAAVWLHGVSATRFGPGLIAEDLPEMLPTVLRDLMEPSREDEMTL